MKKILLPLLLAIGFFASAQNVGIGTTAPVARLQVADSNVVFTGPLTLGFGTAYAPAVQGPGSRMMWYPQKGAFRVGIVNGLQWNKDSIGRFSFATGSNSMAKGEGSFASGSSNAAGDFSTALGISTASGDFSIAIGASAALRYYTTALGGGTASGQYSTAIGVSAASGSFSTAIGYLAKAIGDYSIAMGFSTASASEALSIGFGSTASGEFSVAIGNNATASADYSMATGNYSTASGTYSIATGSSYANGTASSAFGDAVANGDYCFAAGQGNAHAPFSFAVGRGTIASANGGTVIGLSNDVTDTPDPAIRRPDDRIFQIGNGDEFALIRSNAMTVLRNGNTGIAITNPNAPLSFANIVGRKISLYESTLNSQYGFAVEGGDFRMYSDAAAAQISFGYYNGGVFTERMHLNNSTGMLTVVGTNYPSDSRLKKDIIPLQNSLEKIVQLNGYSYHWIDEQLDNNLQIGILAQEVQKLFPQLVSEDRQGTLSVNYSGLIPVLIESVKQQQDQINQLRKEKEELKHVKTELVELKKMIEKIAAK